MFFHAEVLLPAPILDENFDVRGYLGSKVKHQDASIKDISSVLMQALSTDARRPTKACERRISLSRLGR